MNKIKEKRSYQRFGRICLLTFVFSFVVLIGGCGFAKQSGDILLSTENRESDSYGTGEAVQGEKKVSSEAMTSTQQTQGTLAVYVCGAVVNPGVYELSEGARIVDALSLAGGYRSDAALEYLNQAEYVEDGQKLYVPTEREAEQMEEDSKQQDRALDSVKKDETADSGQNNADMASQKLDINRASLEELMTLPGIGQAKAQAIIAYRKEHGQFTSIEELKNINGIKDGVYNKVKDSITVG